jgi:hypothetical protein
MESIKETMANQDFNSETEKRLSIRICIFKLLNYLAYDDSTSVKIAYDLMESFIKDFLNQNFTEDLTQIAGLLATLFRTRRSIDPFIQNSGHEALCVALEKFYEHRKFILNCFKMIKEMCFSSDENKKNYKNVKLKIELK